MAVADTGGAGIYCCCGLLSLSLSIPSTTPPYSYSSSRASSRFSPPIVPGSGAVGLLRCFASTATALGDTREPGGDVLPNRPPLVEDGDTRLLGGDTLPSLGFEVGDNLPNRELELGRPGGETRPTAELLDGDVRGGGRSMTVGEPMGAGIDRSVSESRRLWP